MTRMHLVHPNSLSDTVNAVNEAFFFEAPIPNAARREAAAWIAARQGLPGAYGGLFAGFPAERSTGIQLFTGERVTSASARHILGEEACRALRLLNVGEPATAAALGRANDWLADRLRLAAAHSPRNNDGVFCCGKCTVGLWRHILSGGLDRHEHRLQLGLTRLRAERTINGAWRAFPFWYTVLALAEMDGRQAREELTHAARRIEAEAHRPARPSPHATRRNTLARRALAHL